MKTSSNNNNIESKNQSVYVTVSNGIVQDIFPNRDTAINDMHRHVYNTLVGCCGGKVEGDGETCCVVSYQDKEQNDICMVVPFDPNNRDHREAYNAQRDIWHLPELPAIKEAEDVRIGDKVRHNKHEEVATVTAIREAFVNRADGYRYLYTLDFGQSVLGPFQVELNGGEFLREAFTLCNPSEITEQREQNDACISSAESRRDKANGQIKAAHEEQKRTFGQAFDAEYYKPIIEAIKGRKVFHFGIPADTVRIEVRRECEGYYRIRMKRAASEYVESMSEYIDWETILNTERAARLLSDLCADHTRAHCFKIGDMVRVNDPEFKQIYGHVGRITKVYLRNQLVGTRYTVEFVGELPTYQDGQPMKENDFEPLDIEPAA